MIKTNTHKILFCWFLSALIIVPLTAKTIHFFLEAGHEASCEHHGSHHGPPHDSHTCLVCQFMVSPFITRDSFTGAALLTSFHPVFILYQEKVSIPDTFYHYLRAPPLNPVYPG